MVTENPPPLKGSAWSKEARVRISTREFPDTPVSRSSTRQ